MNENFNKTKEIFKKLIKPIQGVDVFDEYIKIRLKKSKLSASKRKAVMTHIMVNYNKSEEIRNIIDQLDEMIIKEVMSYTKVLPE